MFTRKNLIAILSIVLLGSCGNKTISSDGSEVITINPHKVEDSVNLSEIADSVKCIKLQVAPGDIMGNVREIIIKKKYIYAYDISQKIIFIFDKAGQFVAKLDKKGQGPDEYIYMKNIFVDDNEEYIEIVAYKGGTISKLKYANLSFELLDVSPFPNLNYSACRRSDSLYYFATPQSDNIINGKETNATLLIANGENIKTLFDQKIETNNDYYIHNVESFVKNDKNELFVSLVYDNTFYRLEAEEAYPAFTVDFGKYGMDNNIGLKSTKEQMEYIKKMNGLAAFPILNINNADILSFSYHFKRDTKDRFFKETDFRQYIKMKNTNKVFHVKKIKNDITGFPDRVYISSYFFGCAHDVLYEDYLVDIVMPNHYFSEDKTEKIFVDGIGEITAEDDPIVVMMKLKK